MLYWQQISSTLFLFYCFTSFHTFIFLCNFPVELSWFFSGLLVLVVVLALVAGWCDFMWLHIKTSLKNSLLDARWPFLRHKSIHFLCGWKDDERFYHKKASAMQFSMQQIDSWSTTNSLETCTMILDDLEACCLFSCAMELILEISQDNNTTSRDNRLHLVSIIAVKLAGKLARKIIFKWRKISVKISDSSSTTFPSSSNNLHVVTFITQQYLTYRDDFRRRKIN